MHTLERQKRTGNGPASQEGAGCQKSFFRRRIDQYRRQPSTATPRRPNTALRETLASFWLYSPQIPMSAATACGQVSRSSRRGRLCAAADQAVVESANRGTGGRLGLTVNEAKTSLRNARQECFTFLGYSFGPHWYKANGHRYLGASPSKKSVQRLKTTVGNLLVAERPCGAPDLARDHASRAVFGLDEAGQVLPSPLGPRPIGFAIYEAERVIVAVSDGRTSLVVTTVDGASNPDLSRQQVRHVHIETPRVWS